MKNISRDHMGPTNLKYLPLDPLQKFGQHLTWNTVQKKVRLVLWGNQIWWWKLVLYFIKGYVFELVPFFPSTCGKELIFTLYILLGALYTLYLFLVPLKDITTTLKWRNEAYRGLSNQVSHLRNSGIHIYLSGSPR